MTRLLERPLAEPVPFDPDALIEEARRRARRRRAAYGLAALLALAAALVAFFEAGGGGSSKARRPQAGRPSSGLPTAGRVVGTLRFSPSETVLFTARAGSLFELVPQPPSKRVAVVRVGSDGATARSSFVLGPAEFLTTPAAGPEGLYAGTAVIRRFTDAPDELVRIDPETLALRARASFPAWVEPVAQGPGLWASVGDGRVVRLDPRTLAVQASRRLVPAPVSRPAAGLGSVWVLAGDARRLELVRLDPTSLRVRSLTRVPAEFDALVADPRHVYLSGPGLIAVGADGGLLRRSARMPGLATAAVHGSNLVGLLNRPALVLLTPRGTTVARTPLLDDSALLAISGRDVWFDGDAGGGEGIVHVRLR